MSIMTPDEIESMIAEAREYGCVDAYDGEFADGTPRTEATDLADTLEAYAAVVQKVAETPAHAYGQDEDREYVYLKLPKATHDRSRELRGLSMTNGATPDSGALDDALTRIAYETQFGVPMPKMEKQWPTSDGQLGDQ